MLLAAIDSAHKEVLVAVQELSLPRVAEALVAKHRQGVLVKVVLENTYSTPWSEDTPRTSVPICASAISN
jgi:hypothetical protein